MQCCNELRNQTESISIRATIIDTSFDLIVGRRDIFRHDLIFKTYKQVFGDYELSTDTGPTGTSQYGKDVKTALYSFIHGAHTVPVNQSLESGTAHST